MSQTKIPGPEFGLVEYLNYFTEEETREMFAKPSSRMPLRPSAAGDCERALYYGLKEYEGELKIEKEPYDAATSRIFAYGHDTEYHFIKQLRKVKNFHMTYSQQVLTFFRLPKRKVLIKGSIDGVAVANEGDWSLLVDYKSKKDKFSTIAKTNWDEWAEKLRGLDYVTEFGEESFYIEDLDRYYEEFKSKDYFTMKNFLQLNFYFHSEDNFAKLHDVQACSLLYYNKNDSRIREIRFNPSQKLYDQVKEKFMRVDAATCEDEATKEHNLGSAACAFCTYNKQCWGDKDALKDYFKTLGFKMWPKDTNRLGALGDQLEDMFDEFRNAKATADAALKHEQDIAKLMHDNKIKKIRLEDGEIYEIRNLKSGGIGGGPRMVLRRGKL